MNKKGRIPEITIYWIVMILWLLIPFGLKYIFGIYNKWTYIIFALSLTVYMTIVDGDSSSHLKEYIERQYPNLIYKYYHDVTTINSVLFRYRRIYRESKNYPDKEFQDKALKARRMDFFLNVWRVVIGIQAYIYIFFH